MQIKKKTQQSLPGLKGNAFLVPNDNRIYSNTKKAKIARDILERYTGSPVDRFRKQIILTNFDYYVERFDNLCGDERYKGSAMRVVHSSKEDVSIIDFSIGSPTAALIIEILSVVEPKAVLLLGMCGGLHRSLKVGDFIITRPNSGTRMKIHGTEWRLINDDSVEAVVQDPRGIQRPY